MCSPCLLILLMKRFFNGLENPGGLEQMRETCSFHRALIACHNSSVVTNYDKNILCSMNGKICTVVFFLYIEDEMKELSMFDLKFGFYAKFTYVFDFLGLEVSV